MRVGHRCGAGVDRPGVVPAAGIDGRSGSLPGRARARAAPLPDQATGLWSGQPVSFKLEDLDVICVVLSCEIGDLLIPEPQKVTRPGQDTDVRQVASGSSGQAPAVVPRRRDGRSLPPM
ncbi:helix-turn-helix transcriptional regulator [Streptomyces sp. NPDC050619]|uniref:helix-turn-helix domain-containing protein n=1 Tax=Streptomyces sp. NPDC050619 TaxID=3157214 RepID=UPI0034286796